MTPEEARRIVAACGLPVAEPETVDVTGRVSTSEIAHALGIGCSSVIAFLKKHKFRPIKMVNTYAEPLMWTKKAFKFIKDHHKSLREQLPDGVEWITAKEALSILKCSQPTLCRHVQSIRRFVDGKVICYYDKNEVLNLAKLWLKLK